MLQRIIMNNKGFTLIEVLSVLVIISIISITVFMSLGTTLSVNKNEAYNLMKDNIIAASYDYINECNLGTINCNFSFNNNNSFNARTLQNAGFFKDLESPIDGSYLGDCLIVEATKSNGVTVVNLTDKCY